MKKLLLTLSLLLTPVTAFASPCDQFFPNKREIVVPNTTVLCNTFYATVYDTNKEKAIFSTEAFLPHANKVERTNDFHADTRLGKASPTPSDYDNTGYDRGHLTPAADAASSDQMSNTFLMTNMTPQEPTVNRISWRMLETKVRNMSAAYVITGAVYSRPIGTIGHHAIPIPTSYYKIVYLKDGSIKAFRAENIKNAPVVEVDVQDIEKLSGIKFH